MSHCSPSRSGQLSSGLCTSMGCDSSLCSVDKSSNSGGLQFRCLLSVASLELVRLFQGPHCVVWAGSKCEENLWVWLSKAVSPCHSISPPPPLPSVDSKLKWCQGRHSSTLLTFLALQCIVVEKQVTEVPGIHALLHWSISSKWGRLAGALMSYQSPMLR